MWWADLPEPVASDPGGNRPILVVQTDALNTSRIATVLAVILTTNERLAFLQGNVALSARETGLKRTSVANVSQIITADRRFFTRRVGRIRPETMAKVEAGLRLVFGLK